MRFPGLKRNTAESLTREKWRAQERLSDVRTLIAEVEG